MAVIQHTKCSQGSSFENDRSYCFQIEFMQCLRCIHISDNSVYGCKKNHTENQSRQKKNRKKQKHTNDQI